MKGMVDESRLVDWHGPFVAICILDITVLDHLGNAACRDSETFCFFSLGSKKSHVSRNIFAKKEQEGGPLRMNLFRCLF